MNQSADIYLHPSLNETKLPAEFEVSKVTVVAIDPAVAAQKQKDLEKAKNILLAIKLQLSRRPD